MATLLELKSLFTDPVLGDKVEAACVIVAEEIRAEDSGTANHANRYAWAKTVWTNSAGARDGMLKAILGANNTATVAVINAASDATILAAVRNAVNVFATGG